MKGIKRKIIKGIDDTTRDIGFGAWVFGLGLLITIVMAIVVALTDVSQTVGQVVLATLIVLGIIIGVMNISSQETTHFLVATLVLIMLIGPFLGNVMQVYSLGETFSKILSEFFKNLIGFIVPASIIVALKTLFTTARD